MDVAVAGSFLFGLLGGSGLALGLTHGAHLGPAWVMLLLGTVAVFAALYALYKANRGWRLVNMKKGARAEETIGQAIEYALTRESCAVAHHVEEIARVGDIDHLVATPGALWVIETKHGRVPKPHFRKVLRRIARNVEAVREWAPPNTKVTGCLVFGSEQERRPAPSYSHGSETIKAFADPAALRRALRKEADRTGGSADLARRVWKLGKEVDIRQPGRVRVGVEGAGRS